MEPYRAESVDENEVHDDKPSENVEDDDDKSQPDSGGGVDSSLGKIFVGGLPWQTTSAEFEKHFGKYGEITDSVIMTDKTTGEPRGFGFVTYADPSVIHKVFQDNHIIHGKQVEIKRTIPRGSKRLNVFKTKKLFVGGIPSSVDDDEFKECFMQFGELKEHQIMRDHSTGKSRGFGFVTYESEDVGDQLLAKGNRIEFSGTTVVCGICRKIFVGGLHWQTTSEEFVKHFGKYGEITDSVIMTDKTTGEPRGFGFVTYADPSVIHKVFQDNHIIHGKQVEVKARIIPGGSMQVEIKPTKPGGSMRFDDFKTKRIFVGGIPYYVNDDEFKEFFMQFGEVKDHQIMRDHHSTGNSRGFGFVTYESEDVVDQLLAKGKRIEFSGTTVEIKRAEPKISNSVTTPSEQFSYGGGHGGGYVGPGGPYESGVGGYGGYGGEYGGYVGGEYCGGYGGYGGEYGGYVGGEYGGGVGPYIVPALGYFGSYGVGGGGSYNYGVGGGGGMYGVQYGEPGGGYGSSGIGGEYGGGMGDAAGGGYDMGGLGGEGRGGFGVGDGGRSGGGYDGGGGGSGGGSFNGSGRYHPYGR